MVDGDAIGLEVKHMKEPICPGCENVIEGAFTLYFGEYWHPECAKEDKRINDCMDADDRRREPPDNYFD